jgi:hypothetical protein
VQAGFKSIPCRMGLHPHMGYQAHARQCPGVLDMVQRLCMLSAHPDVFLLLLPVVAACSGAMWVAGWKRASYSRLCFGLGHHAVLQACGRGQS